MLILKIMIICCLSLLLFNIFISRRNYCSMSDEEYLRLFCVGRKFYGDIETKKIQNDAVTTARISNL